MSFHCRCTQCKARRAISKPLSQYLRPPKCRNCNGELKPDSWMNNRNTKAMTCACNGHGRGFHYPHRRGSLWCNYQPQGEWKTFDQFKAEHLTEETQ